MFTLVPSILARLSSCNSLHFLDGSPLLSDPPALSIFPVVHMKWGSPVANMVKNLLAMRETQVQSLGQEDPLPFPVFLPGKFQGQRSLVGYSPRGCKESHTIERLTLSLSAMPIDPGKKIDPHLMCTWSFCHQIIIFWAHTIYQALFKQVTNNRNKAPASMEIIFEWRK